MDEPLNNRPMFEAIEAERVAKKHSPNTMKSNTTLTRKRELLYFDVEVTKTRLELALWAFFIMTVTFRSTNTVIQCIATVLFAIMFTFTHWQWRKMQKLSQEIRSEME